MAFLAYFSALNQKEDKEEEKSYMLCKQGVIGSNPISSTDYQGFTDISLVDPFLCAYNLHTNGLKRFLPKV
jgi:hypothetical protein